MKEASYSRYSASTRISLRLPDVFGNEPFHFSSSLLRLLNSSSEMVPVKRSLILSGFYLAVSLLSTASAFQFGTKHRSSWLAGKQTSGRTLRPSSSCYGASVEGIASGEQSQEATLDWSFLDGVYLITCPNADPGGQRLEKAKRILDSVGLEGKVQVKEFDTDDENRIRGCYTSHISVLSDVLAASRQNTQGSKNVLDDLFGAFSPRRTTASQGKNANILVLEDNLALSSGQLRQGLIDSVAQYIATDPDWDIVHLSYIPYVPDLKLSRTESKDIVKLSCGVGSALGTTAYIINTRAMEKLLQDEKNNNGFYAPIPDVMAKLFPESRYATNPTIFVRAPNTKSLVNPQLDDLRSFLFLPSVAAFAQQLLIVTGLTTNMLLPIVVLVLLGASGASLVSFFGSLWSLWSTGDLDGPIIFPLVSGAFSVFSLGILAKGAMLAPKQEVIEK